MKLYAIRDRLIDYYMQPFIGPDDKPVMAAVATQVNSEEINGPIQKAPQHFELWTLAEIDEETGAVTPNARLLADCASLVRPGLRETGAGTRHPAAPAAPGSPGTARRDDGRADTNAGALPLTPPRQAGSAEQAHSGHRGGTSPANELGG